MFDRSLRRYMRQGTLTQLAAFDTVVRLGSFTRAAEALHMAQPTVSLLVKKLAQTLDAPLFESTTSGIRLSPAGRETYRLCNDLFPALAAFAARLAAVRNRARTTIRIAVCAAAEATVLQWICGFCKDAAEVRLVVSVANHAELQERLAASMDDLYIFGTSPAAPDIYRHPLCQDELHVYASITHPFARRRRLTMIDIAREPLLVREPGSATREALETLLAGHPITVHMEMNDDAAIKRAVGAGHGVALLSCHAVSPNPRREALTVLKVDGLPIRRQWQLVYRPDKHLSLTEQRLIVELCRAAGAHASPSGSTLRARRRRKLSARPASAGRLLEGTS